MKHKLFSFSAILAAILSLTGCGSGESAADVNYSEIAASDGSLVFTTSSTPEISTEPSVEPIIPSSEILEETSTVPATESTTITTSTETVVTVPAPEPSEHHSKYISLTWDRATAVLSSFRTKKPCSLTLAKANTATALLPTYMVRVMVRWIML